MDRLVDPFVAGYLVHGHISQGVILILFFLQIAKHDAQVEGVHKKKAKSETLEH